MEFKVGMEMRTRLLLTVALVACLRLVCSNCSAEEDIAVKNDFAAQLESFESDSGDVFDDEILDHISKEQTSERLGASIAIAVERHADDSDVPILEEGPVVPRDTLASTYYARRSITTTEPVPEPVGLSLLGMAMVFILMAYSIFRKQQEAAFSTEK